MKSKMAAKSPPSVRLFLPSRSLPSPIHHEEPGRAMGQEQREAAATRKLLVAQTARERKAAATQDRKGSSLTAMAAARNGGSATAATGSKAGPAPGGATVASGSNLGYGTSGAALAAGSDPGPGLGGAGVMAGGIQGFSGGFPLPGVWLDATLGGSPMSPSVAHSQALDPASW